MTGGQLAGRDHVLNLIRQGQKAQRVGDVAAATRQGLCNLFLRMAETVHQLPIGQCLFQGTEISPLDVFDDRNLKHFGVAKAAHKDRNLMQLRDLRGTPAAFSGDDLVLALLARGAHDQRLDHTFLSDRLRKLLQGSGIKMAPGLIRVCHEPLNGHQQIGARVRGSLAQWAVEMHVSHKRAQPPTECATFRFLFHLMPPRANPAEGDDVPTIPYPRLYKPPTHETTGHSPEPIPNRKAPHSDERSWGSRF